MATSFRNHIVAEGDTIQSVAHQVLGDMTRWVELAEFNNLRHPYIVDTVEEKLKNPEHLVTIGDILLVKVSKGEQAQLIAELRDTTTYDQEEIYALALGKDLDLMPISNRLEDASYSNELLELKGNYRGDVATVRGVDNLKQSLFIRVTTPKGSYIGHPNYGSEVHKYMGKKNTEENATQLDLEIERTLRTDRRVSNVIFNGHTISGNTYTGAFTVYTLNMQEAFEFVVQGERNGPIILLNQFRASQ